METLCNDNKSVVFQGNWKPGTPVYGDDDCLVYQDAKENGDKAFFVARAIEYGIGRNRIGLKAQVRNYGTESDPKDYYVVVSLRELQEMEKSKEEICTFAYGVRIALEMPKENPA